MSSRSLSILHDGSISRFTAERRQSTALTRDRRWIIAFVVAAFVFDVGLFSLGSGSLRLPLRIGAFGLSLAYLAVLWRRRPAAKLLIHPAARWAYIAAAVLFIGLLNPSGDRPLARVATDSVYIAVLAPLMWVGCLKIDKSTFRKVVLIMWAFYSTSSLFGVLQVEIPGPFDGALSTNYDAQSLIPNIFKLADGRKIIRPKGLSDNPGGAGTAGVYTIILGTGLLLTERNLLLKITATASMGMGLFCIYICQGRSNLIIVGIAEIAVMALLIRRKVFGRAIMLAGVGFAVTMIGTAVAFSVGGQTTSDRFFTLIADDPSNVYEANRGQFLNEILTQDMWQWPLGAGQGRWGMMNFYFGNPSDGLWAEMQWQALLYDGGIPLIIIYAAIIGSLLLTAIVILKKAASIELACWAAVVFGYVLSAAAATFSFPLFCHDMGIQLMLLNGCLYAAYRQEISNPARVRTKILIKDKLNRQVRSRRVLRHSNVGYVADRIA